MKSYIFWDIVTCSPLKVKSLSGGTLLFHLQRRRIQLKVVNKQTSACFSEILVDFQRTSKCHTSEDIDLHDNFSIFF